jgi:AbrB family looped-hinge helix DNA binding protein
LIANATVSRETLAPGRGLINANSRTNDRSANHPEAIAQRIKGHHNSITPVMKRTMAATSKLTAQAQVSVPASVRRKLGIGPGSTLTWEAEGDRITVRRVGVHTSASIHDALFTDAPARKTLKALGAGIATHIRKRHARD